MALHNDALREVMAAAALVPVACRIPLLDYHRTVSAILRPRFVGRR
jgi:hypothetical protein